jgi:uncharacterized membrane protein YbaN (DUF454 family)
MIVAKFKKLILIFIGLICLSLGIVGYVIPGMPGTIFLIISATLFVRSSDRLYKFVVENKLFGNQVKGFLETGEIPLRAKVMSISSMWGFTMISVVIAPYGWLFDVSILSLSIAGTWYISSRPSG